MATAPSSIPRTPRLQFARVVRERFLAEAGKALIEISGAVHDQITTLMDEPSNAREGQDRRDTWMAYKKCRPLWVDGTMKVWRECLDPPKVKKQANLEAAGLQLVGTEVVENKILASRMVMAVMDKVSSQLEDLRLRMQFLEGTEELAGNDLLRPEVLVLLMVEQWANSGMPGDSWALVNEVVQKLLVERLKAAYGNANEAMIKKGVMPTIELKDRVKSPSRGATPPARPRASPPSGPSQTSDGAPSAHGELGQGGGNVGYAQGGHTQGQAPYGSQSGPTDPAGDGHGPSQFSQRGYADSNAPPSAGGAEPRRRRILWRPFGLGRQVRYPRKRRHNTGRVGLIGFLGWRRICPDAILETIHGYAKQRGARSLCLRGNPHDDVDHTDGTCTKPRTGGHRSDSPFVCEPCRW
ncbi:MAG: DUF1631 family protein [Burkholderiales bacterium]|nr:DUF1631 family protein [Burkholderiales bacterium]